MRYNVIKDANRIINKSPYLVNNPYDYKNKWATLFENNNSLKGIDEQKGCKI